MKKLKAQEEKERLQAPEGAEFCKDFRREYTEHRQRVSRRWYLSVCVTATLTVLAVTLLLIFGVGAGNRRLSEDAGFSRFAEWAAELFADIDFPIRRGHDTDKDTDSTDNNIFPPIITDGTVEDTSDTPSETEPPSTDVSTGAGGLYDFDYSLVPEGHTPIVPMDLSLIRYGENYINNSSGYTPDVAALLNKNLGQGGYVPLAAESGPVVLIVHTHGTEAYSPDGAISVPQGEEDARSVDVEKNVVSVGRVLAETLIKNGVPTAHCTVMHDSVQYKDSYARAEQTIKKYLAEYPTIKLVIDVHRDSILKSDGELVRPVAEYGGQGAAQLMCVVGTPWEGDSHPRWQDNLSLALKLRHLLNSQCENICRPVFLKSHTYNQELAPYSLLVEVGAGGNSLEEALRSAVLLGEQLATLIAQL